MIKKIFVACDTKNSNDDSGLTFRDKNFCIHHGNDNWFKLSEDNLKKLNPTVICENFPVSPID